MEFDMAGQAVYEFDFYPALMYKNLLKHRDRNRSRLPAELRYFDWRGK
jgi:hypothetical protein